MPARRGAWAVYETFETAEGDQIFVGITSDQHWSRFCEYFDRQDLLRDARYASNEDRVRERDTLLPIVAEIVKRHGKARMTEICDRINIPFAPVAKPEDLFDDPQLNANGRLLDVELPGGIKMRLPRLPIEVGTHDLGLRRQPPEIGQHTREVLLEAGMEESEISRLEAQGVILAK